MQLVLWLTKSVHLRICHVSFKEGSKTERILKQGPCVITVVKPWVTVLNAHHLRTQLDQSFDNRSESSKNLKLVMALLPSEVGKNKSVDTGIFPESLKLAKVTPIYKAKDKENLNNYRPISVLSSLAKVFERIFFNQRYTPNSWKWPTRGRGLGWVIGNMESRHFRILNNMVVAWLAAIMCLLFLFARTIFLVLLWTEEIREQIFCQS